jgi:hypothetical protein
MIIPLSPLNMARLCIYNLQIRIHFRLSLHFIITCSFGFLKLLEAYEQDPGAGTGDLDRRGPI